MPRKTSFCNGTLLRSDLRHYWPAGFLYVLVWLVLLPIPLLQTGFDYARSWADRPELLAAELHNIYYSAMTGSMVLAVLAGIVMPMAVYAYLMAPRAVGLMHALPVKRTTQYFSHFAAGFGLLTGGNVLIFLLSVLAQLPYGGADWAAAGLWLLVTELLELFFLSLGTLCAMATGWLLAIPVLYGAVNFTALLLCTVVQYLQRLFYFGFDSTTYPVFVEWLTPTITLSEAVCSYWGDWVTRDSREVYLRALPERALTVLPSTLRRRWRCWRWAGCCTAGVPARRQATPSPSAGCGRWFGGAWACAAVWASVCSSAPWCWAASAAAS